VTTPVQDTPSLVLTALADAPQHGYGIIGDVERISSGRVRLRAGTLYTALDRLQAEGLIETDHEKAVEDRRLRYYRPSANLPHFPKSPAARTTWAERRPPAAPLRPAPASAASSRLAWLDALRGIAAMMVVLDHSSSAFLPRFRSQLMPWFDCGRYGVMVFFLVSGYVIPASLERRGSVRAFWIGRVFRMYPLWAAAVVPALALHLTVGARLHGDIPHGSADVASAVVAHSTLLQELLGTDSVLVVLWTLSYEMSFYLLVVALFILRRHRGSARISISLAVLAVLAAAIGAATGDLRPSALSTAMGTGRLTAVAATVLVAAVLCASARNRSLRVCGAVLGAVLALVLVPFNGTVPPWEGLVILAVMFLGTAVYRAEHAQIPRRSAAWATAMVLACALGCAYGYSENTFNRRGWTVAFTLAALTFLAALALRHRHLPRLLTGLGMISYSIYLLHPVLLSTIGPADRPKHDDLLLEMGFLAVLLPLCMLTYRYIEAPAQAWGRKLARKTEPRSRTSQTTT
jgi:peptidoglycan/LPS O-acetylase OafA/YrhL